MSYTKPPCWQNGSDCSRRYIACQSSCEEFQAWMAIHEAEKARERDGKHAENDVLAVVSTHSQRTRSAKRALYDAKRRA